MSIENREQTPRPGVHSYRIDREEYVVEVVWKDGTHTTSHFPVEGFDVVNPNDKEHQKLGHIKGSRVLQVLQEQAANFNYGDLDWRNFLNHSNNNSHGK